MTWTAQIEIEGEDFGSMEMEEEVRHGSFWPPSSYAYFCSSCGQVWCRLTVPTRPYFIWSVSCRRCGEEKGAGVHALELPGSVALYWERSIMDHFPRRVLEREFLLHVTEWEKRHVNEA